MSNNPRTEPVSVKVLLTTGEGVAIDWQDGHQSRYSFPYLRDECPCATCREHQRKGESVSPGKVVTPLPMYKEPVKALQAEAVGNYAVRFAFSDGHHTGIYSFEYFRHICPCEECAARRRKEAAAE